MTIEQILEEARIRILTREIHNHHTLAAFFRSWAASGVSVNVEDLTKEAVRRGFYRHFGRLYISLLHVAIDLGKDAIDWRLLQDEAELLVFLKAAADLFRDSHAPEKVLTDLKIDARQGTLRPHHKENRE